MNKVTFDLFPGGVRRCLTMSYDDGSPEDEQLIGIFNRYGIKGTFHVNSNSVQAKHPGKDIAQLYAGHEVSCHMVNHPFPDRIPAMAALQQIMEDKRALERAVGYVVRGMSWPQGAYTDEVIRLARDCGMEYSRTTKATGKFFPLPQDFLQWHPTCHHNKEDIVAKADEFLEEDRYGHMRLFYVWGHSYEFPRDDNWDMMEAFCRKIGGRDNVWYATNIQIVDYVNAMRALRMSADLDKFRNLSALDVWFSVNGEPVCCKAGQSLSL